MSEFQEEISVLYEHVGWLEECRRHPQSDKEKIDAKIANTLKAIEKLKK